MRQAVFVRFRQWFRKPAGPRAGAALRPERLEGRVLFSARDTDLGTAQSTDDATLRGAPAGDEELVTAQSSDGSLTTQDTTAGVLPVMPTSDGYYGAVVNANHYVINYTDSLAPELGLMTDLTGTSAETWTEAVAAVQNWNPQLIIGTYHSTRDAQYAHTLTRYPPRAVPREGLSDRQILMVSPSNPDVHVVDYTQPAARKYLVRHVVQDVANTGRPLAYLDNVSHHESGFPIDWKVTTDVVREMTSKLHDRGRRVVVNAAWVPGVTSDASVEQFIATGADGVSLEMGFHRNVRGSVARIQTAMGQYRRMLDAGMTVILIPLGNATGGENTLENLEAEQRLQAAFGMMFREPGDRLFTNQLFWRPTPEWTGWTESFGPALGGADVATNDLGQIVMTRAFANYTLTANVATKEVTYAVTDTGGVTNTSSGQLVQESDATAPATFSTTPVVDEDPEPITAQVLD